MTFFSFRLKPSLRSIGRSVITHTQLHFDSFLIQDRLQLLCAELHGVVSRH